MKIENKIPEVPFSKKEFNVTLTGLELAVLKLITGKLPTFNKTVCEVSSHLYDTIHFAGIKGCDNELVLKSVVFEDINLQNYITEIDALNKNYDY